MGRDGLPVSKRRVWSEDESCRCTSQDQLADRIAVLDQGQFVAEGTAEQLKRLIPGGHLRLRFGAADDLDLAARVLDDGTRDDEALTLQVPSDGGVRSLRALLDLLDDTGVEPAELSVHMPDLDDVFLALTGSTDNVKVTVQ